MSDTLCPYPEKDGGKTKDKDEYDKHWEVKRPEQTSIQRVDILRGKPRTSKQYYDYFP